MKYFYEIQTPEPLRELSWCNVCFDNLLLETFYLGLSNSRSCLHSQSLQPAQWRSGWSRDPTYKIQGMYQKEREWSPKKF